jgi:hypothetical protein
VKFEATARKLPYVSERNGVKYSDWTVDDEHGWYRHDWGDTSISAWSFVSGAIRNLPDGALVKITVEVVEEVPVAPFVAEARKD